jgi:hypothetical protein
MTEEEKTKLAKHWTLLNVEERIKIFRMMGIVDENNMLMPRYQTISSEAKLEIIEAQQQGVLWFMKNEK